MLITYVNYKNGRWKEDENMCPVIYSAQSVTLYSIEVTRLKSQENNSIGWKKYIWQF